jgi:thiosulfate reductase cytochrome b subunit
MSVGASSLRHPWYVRTAHWVAASSIMALIPSGIVILGYHPELYWGETGFFGDPYFLSFGKRSHEMFSMGGARQVHFLAAWFLVGAAVLYFLWGFSTGYIRTRLFPTSDQLEVSHIKQLAADHFALKHDEADAALRYNLFQKIAYMLVIFVIAPVIVFTGLAMSPNLTAEYPGLIEFWGGRQTARTMHFLAASALFAFLVIHLWQIWLVGVKKLVGPMLTGRAPSRVEGEP